jgi:hypothetical protein
MWAEAAGQVLAKLRHLSVRTRKNHKTCVTVAECDASLNPQTTEFKQDWA